MYDKILVPLDGSRRAEAILSHVEELARRCEARVVLMQVVEPAPVVVGPEGAHMKLYRQDLEEREKRAKSYLTALSGEFREKGIAAQTRVVYGPVVEAIIEIAQREDVQLIAIASHGRTGLSQVFYGSVAAGVLHRAERPLLVVRSRESE